MKTKLTKNKRNFVMLVAGVAQVATAELIARAATITTAGSGNWNSTTANAPWPGGTVPPAGSDVVIANGNSVTNTASLSSSVSAPFTINSSGSM